MLKIVVFCIVTQHRVADMFQRNCCRHHYGLPLMMEAAISSETSVNYYQIKQRHVVQLSLVTVTRTNLTKSSCFLQSPCHPPINIRSKRAPASLLSDLSSGQRHHSGQLLQEAWSVDRTGTGRTQKKQRRKEKEDKVPMLNTSTAACRCLMNIGTAPFISNIGSRRIGVAIFMLRPS